MRNSNKVKLFLLFFSAIFVIATIFIVPMQLKKLKDFKANFVLKEATVVDIKENYDSKDRTSTYSAVYSYTDESGIAYNLNSNVFTSKKPTIGATKQVYINPSNPDVYYNGKGDITIPIIILPIVCVFLIAGTGITFVKLR